MSQQKVSRNLAQVKRGALHIGVDLGLENNVAISPLTICPCEVSKGNRGNLLL